jgi:hypothetical protein
LPISPESSVAVLAFVMSISCLWQLCNASCRLAMSLRAPVVSSHSYALA